MSTVVDKVKDWVSGGPEPGEEEEFGGPELTLVEHLMELRSRLTKCAYALVVGTVIGLIFSDFIFGLLKHPAPANIDLVAIEMTEMFMVYFKVAIMTGVAIGMPVFVYQIFAFVAPGLTRKERRWVFRLLPLVSFFFVLGMAFAYFVVLPFAIHYLLTFSDIAKPTIRITDYVGFVTTVELWLGAAFETPLIIYMLAKLNVVSVERLTKYRKYAILAVFIIAAAITPTPDPFNQTLVAIPLYLLYELGILFARIA
ncbi:MAG TPA: twin-arginine translocase subunit TatC [Chloroflexota bacterium]|nr:twin-arginine translocase subunit TatC [Chloroflexota bacterium]